MREKFSTINTPADVRSLLLYAELNGDDPAALHKRIEAGFEVDLVKQNPKRKVYRLRCPEGREMYLKLFAGQAFPQSLFRFYAQQEYQAARRLESLGLPVIHYLAWGRLHRGGFSLSEGVSEAVSLRQYCFETLVHQPDLQFELADRLSDVIRLMIRNRIRHPDFHLGNILLSRSSGNLYLADPWGVRPVWFLRESDRLNACLPWVELSGTLSDELVLPGIVNSDLARDTASAKILFEAAHARREQFFARHRAKFDARILSGRSKFATEVTLPEGRCAFRHTEWYAPPAKFELDPAWRREEFATEEASRGIWLGSFLKTPPVKNPPLARLIRLDGTSVLFFADDK